MRVKNESAMPWRGRDYNGKELSLASGESCEMSDRRAEKLVADFPGRFVLLGPAVGHPRVTDEARPPSGPGSPVEVVQHPNDTSGAGGEFQVDPPRRRRRRG